MEKMSIKTGRNLVLKMLVSFNDRKTTIQCVDDLLLVVLFILGAIIFLFCELPIHIFCLFFY